MAAPRFPPDLNSEIELTYQLIEFFNADRRRGDESDPGQLRQFKGNFHGLGNSREVNNKSQIMFPQ